MTTSQLDITNESQEVSPFPAGDKASINRHAQKYDKYKTEKTNDPHWNFHTLYHMGYPIYFTGETLLSPLVMCGPHGLKFNHPVELRLPHCASVNPDSWSFALKSSDSPTGKL